MHDAVEVNDAALDAYLEAKRRALRLPGLAVAVVQGGQIVYLRGLGNAGPGRAMTPQTPLVLGSLSKSITALAVMQLVEAGKLDLDAPVRGFIPWFCLADPVASSSITIRHLLAHTSGLSRHAGRELLADRGGNTTIEQRVRELATLKLTKPVGAGFQYSNTNYMIAGLVVKVVAGQSFEEYVQQQIFAPLGMQHSHASERAAQQDGLATGYRWWFGMPRPSRAPYLDEAVPAAFITSSAEDMARYLIAQLDGGAIEGVSVLSPAGVAELHRPQVATAPGSFYALGWRVEHWGAVPVVRHGGEVSNFLTEAVMLPEQRVGVVVLMNVSNGLVPLAVKDASRLGSDIARFLLGVPSASERRLSLRSFSALTMTALATLSVWQAWSWVRLLRGRGRRRHAAIVELLVPVAALRAIPRLADAPWRLLRLYVPDVTPWILALLGSSFAKGLIRMVGSVRRSPSF